MKKKNSDSRAKFSRTTPKSRCCWRPRCEVSLSQPFSLTPTRTICFMRAKRRSTGKALLARVRERASLEKRFSWKTVNFTLGAGFLLLCCPFPPPSNVRVAQINFSANRGYAEAQIATQLALRCGEKSFSFRFTRQSVTRLTSPSWNSPRP